MINLDDIADGVGELERASKLGLCGAMITVNPILPFTIPAMTGSGPPRRTWICPSVSMSGQSVGSLGWTWAVGMSRTLLTTPTVSTIPGSVSTA